LNEWTMAAVFGLLLLLWAVGGRVWDLSGTVSAFTGVALLLVTGVLTWGDQSPRSRPGPPWSGSPSW
jgi:DASS family divalent anion:Na+ symporter